MARKQKVTKAEIIDALKRAHGLKTGAAELLGVAFNTIDSYCGKYAEAQAIVDHWRKRRVDRAEYKLDEALERGEAWAISLVLKSARDREYNDRVKVEITWREQLQGLGIDPDTAVQQVREWLAAGGALAEIESNE